MAEKQKDQGGRPMMVDLIFTRKVALAIRGSVEAETQGGKSINVGAWVQREDGQWVFRLKALVPTCKGEETGGPEHTSEDLDWDDDMRVWVITLRDGDQRVWVAAESRSEALGVAEDMDYFEPYWDDQNTSIKMMAPHKRLSIWMCHNDESLIPDLLKPYIEEDQDPDWHYLTINAPCALWAQAKQRADLLADSEASC